MTKYFVTKRPHYINNRTYKPGEIVDLPETGDPKTQITPGKLLVPYTKPVPKGAAPQPEPVEIPENWRSLNDEDRLALARKIGPANTKAAKADEVIENEVARRAAA